MWQKVDERHGMGMEHWLYGETWYWIIMSTQKHTLLACSKVNQNKWLYCKFQVYNICKITMLPRMSLCMSFDTNTAHVYVFVRFHWTLPCFTLVFFLLKFLSNACFICFPSHFLPIYLSATLLVGFCGHCFIFAPTNFSIRFHLAYWTILTCSRTLSLSLPHFHLNKGKWMPVNIQNI